MPFKKTFAILAKELNVPIVPVCIRGAFEALPRGSSFMRPKPIEVKFLEPLTPFKGNGEEPLTYEELTRRTQDAIEKCLS